MALTDATTRVIVSASEPVLLVLSGTVVRGDLVGYSSGWKQADADGGIVAVFVAGESGVSGDTITGYRQAHIDGFTGGTVGGTAYVSDTAGAMSETVSEQVAGVILTATEVSVNLVPTTAGKLAVALTGLASAAYGFSSIVTQTSAKSDGIAGYFEGHVAGTPTGASYAFGAWMNVDTTPGGVELRAADFGMYARGQDLSSTALLGLNIGMHADAANAPSSMYPIRFNCFQTGSTPDGLFRASNHEAIASTLGAGTTSTKAGDIAIAIVGTTYYLRYYDAAG